MRCHVHAVASRLPTVPDMPLFDIASPKGVHLIRAPVFSSMSSPVPGSLESLLGSSAWTEILSRLIGHLPCACTAPGALSWQEEDVRVQTLLTPCSDHAASSVGGSTRVRSAVPRHRRNNPEDPPGSAALSLGTEETTRTALSTALLGITPQVLRHKDIVLASLTASSSPCSGGK